MKWIETGKSLILGILFCDRWSQFANARIGLAVLARTGPTHGTATQPMWVVIGYFVVVSIQWRRPPNRPSNPMMIR